MKKTLLSIVLALALCLCLSPVALATGGSSVSYITAEGSAYLSYESDGTTNLLDYVNLGSTANNGTYYLLKTGDTSTRSIRALTFNGDTKLYLADSLSIEESLTFNGNALVILGDSVTLTVNGVLSCTGALTITTVENAENAKLIVKGGTRADNNGYGIYAGGSLCIYAGTVDATGGNVTADNTKSYGIYVDRGSLIISGSGTSVTATGGTAKGESHGIYQAEGYANDSVSITNSTVEAFGGTATNSSTGIRIRNNPLSISGNAKVTAESGSNVTEGYGIHGIKNVTINGGKVTATAGAASSNSYGIEAINGGVTITGGTVTATSGAANNKSCGIWAKSVSIADATVTAYSDGSTTESHGIFAGRSGSTASGNSISIGQTAGKTTTLYGKDSGPVSLSAYDLTYNGGALKLAADSAFTKSLSSSDSNRSFLSLLPAGYAFALRTTDGKAVNEISPKVGYVEGGTIVLKVCDHMNGDTSARESGICKYCGGAGALVKNSTTGTEYANFALAYTAAKNGDTIMLLSDVSDALTINDPNKKITLDLNGHNATDTITVSVPATITDSVGGGTITTLTTTGDVKIGGLLAEGYGFKSGSAWYDGSSEATSVSNVTVKKVPFKDLTITAVTNVTGDQTAGFRWDYGKNASFRICATDNITASSGDTAVTLSGTYALKQNGTVKADGTISVTTPGESWIAGASHFDGTEDLAQAASLQISGTLLPVGSYTLEITVTATGQSGYYETISVPVTVNKGTLSMAEDHYGTPDPMTALIYNAQEQVLIIPSGINLPNGTRYLYSLDKINWKANVSDIKGRDAKSYTVYWMVDGGDNYNDVTNTQPLTVAIAKKNISAGMETRIVYVSIPDLPFIGQPQTPTPVLKLRSKGDNNSEVVEYETLTEDTDYTVTVTSQTNAGDYELTLTGKGNYTGTRTGSWSISKAPAPTLRDIPVSRKYTATDAAVQLGNLMPDDAGTLEFAKGGTVGTTGAVEVTDWSVSSTGAVSVSFSGGAAGDTITLPVTIHSANYADATVNVVVTLTEKDAQAALTITSPNTATYRTTLQLMESGGSGSGRVSWSVVDGTGSAVINNGSILYPTKAGTVIVTATKAGDNSYNEISSEPMTITIAPLQISGEPLYTPITTGGKTLKDAALRRNDSWYKFSSLFGWVDKDGNPLPDSTEVQQNTAYTWRLLLDESEAGNCTPMLLSGEIVLWRKSAPPASKPTVTVPVSSDADSVEVKASVSGGNATVEVSDEQIEKVAQDGSGAVTVDVSGLKNAESATLPAHVVEKADKAKDTALTVALPSGSVTLDEKALASVSEGEDVTVSVRRVPATDLNEAQQKAVGDMANIGIVVDVDLHVGSAKRSSFNGGKLTISVPYTPKKGEDVSRLTVWFIKDDGTIENMGGYYDAAKGCFVFETTHLSRYLLVNTAEAQGFVDVPVEKYFYSAVNWAASSGITGGVDETHFAPYASCTRGQLVTFLWRAAGCPAAKNANTFSDVAAGRYCEKAIAWAAENEIVGGYDDGTFRPDATVTRQQTAAILWRFAKYAGMDVTVGEDTNILSYSDALSISDYAFPAIQWAVGAEVMGGSGDKLLPRDTCTRAQIVTMLYRCLAK